MCASGEAGRLFTATVEEFSEVVQLNQTQPDVVRFGSPCGNNRHRLLPGENTSDDPVEERPPAPPASFSLLKLSSQRIICSFLVLNEETDVPNQVCSMNKMTPQPQSR